MGFNFLAIYRQLINFGGFVISASFAKIKSGFKEGYEILATALRQGTHISTPRHYPYY